MTGASEHIHHPKGLLSDEMFFSVESHTERMIDRAREHGVTMTVALQNGYGFRQQADELENVRIVGPNSPVFAASHAKLAVAAFELDHVSHAEQQISAVERMLRHSDNDVFADLKDGRAELINTHAREHAGIRHDILRIREDGSSFSGLTTASDSLRLFVGLLSAAKRLKRRDEIASALMYNTTKYGVRQMLRPDTAVRLINKTGDCYGHADAEVGECVHHDVGVVFTGKHSGNHRLLYSITTSTGTPGRARLADQLNRHLGAEYIRAVGGTPARSLGHRAVSAFLDRPRFGR